MTPRTAVVERSTSESTVRVALNLDGTGASTISTGVGFYDHMLTALAKHSLIDLEVTTTGDLHIDGHHSIEDTAIVIGQALREALGDKRGIVRFGDATVPLDEALVRAVVDVSGRPYLAYHVEIARWQLLGDYDVFLTPEFFRALVLNAGLTVHLDLLRGENPHHIVEATFKAFARALDQATSRDPRVAGVPSTKGAL